MFLDKSQWKANELRQGDVLAGVPFPYASALEQQIIAEYGPQGASHFPQLTAKMMVPPEIGFFSGQLPMKMSFCVVITQCCELVTNAKGALRFVQAVSVCRLVPPTPTMKSDKDKLEMLRKNPDPRKGEGYKNYFYYGAPPELGAEELMADFSQTGCILSKEFPKAMAAKILQLDDRTRMKFKIKLGFFHASPTDEEIAAGISQDPWAEPIPESK